MIPYQTTPERQRVQNQGIKRGHGGTPEGGGEVKPAA
jgi:hypothetical protein